MDQRQKEMMEILFRETSGKMFIYSQKCLGNSSLAEEAVQETFRIACSTPEKVLSSPNPGGWLMNALKYTLHDIFREQKKIAAILELCQMEQHTPEPPIDENLDPDILYKDLADDKDYILLKQFANAGVAITAFAKVLDISPEACKKRIQRARARMQKRMTD